MKGLCKFHQRGYCKWGAKCRNPHEDLVWKSGLFCHENECRSRHLRKCIYFAVDGFCKFGDQWSYVHTSDRNVNRTDCMDEINSLKVEIEMLKNQIKTTDIMKQERNVF